VAAVLLTVPLGLSAGEPGVDAEAAKILKNSTTYLSGLQQFGLVANSSIEAVLETGQKIQFDNDIAAVMKRPNLFYAARLGDLVEQEFFYDGKTLTLHDVAAGYYATLPAPDTLDGMFDFARDSLDIVAPAGDFIYTNAYDILMEDVESGFVVGESVIEGVVCDHLAFSKPGTDFQVWTAQGDKPVPLKIVITSRDVMNAPQFTVLISEWDIVTEYPDEKFAFDKHDEAEEIDFIILDPAEN
jgi:hypothetical protein